MRFYIPQLTNTAHNFHLLYFFQLFGFKLIPKSNSYTHILLIANIYNYFSLNRTDALNLKNIKIYNFLNSNCPNASNSKKQKQKEKQKQSKQIVSMLSVQKISKFTNSPQTLPRCFQPKKYQNKYLNASNLNSNCSDIFNLKISNCFDAMNSKNIKNSQNILYQFFIPNCLSFE